MSSSGSDHDGRVYLKRANPKPKVDDAGVDETVRGMLKEIREGGEARVQRYATELDKYDGPILLSKDYIDRACETVPPATRADVEAAYGRIKKFAQLQRQSITDIESEIAPGMVAGHRVTPLDVAGCYVPGGRYAHIASALMTVGVARAAGVKTVVACSPPRPDVGGVHPVVLYAMRLCGVDHVLCLGGVQGLASLAYGLFTGAPAEIIVGPGNRFVIAAKRQLFGGTGIDLVAGPTEACVLADAGADARVVAADLVSQAEHGLDSPTVLITDDRALAEKVLNEEVPRQIAALPEGNAANTSWPDYGEVILVADREAMAVVSDEVASEHLEVQCADLPWWKARLRNYGAVFLGEEVCVSHGDKALGPNHVLPTRGAGRYTGGLNALSFCKIQTYSRVTREANRELSAVTARISRAEGMEGHARAADVRLEKYFPGETFDLAAAKL